MHTWERGDLRVRQRSLQGVEEVDKEEEVVDVVEVDVVEEVVEVVVHVTESK